MALNINFQSLQNLTQNLGVNPEPWTPRGNGEHVEQWVSRSYNEKPEAEKVAKAVVDRLHINNVMGVSPSSQGGFRVVIYDITSFADGLDRYTSLLEKFKCLEKIELTKEQLERAKDLLNCLLEDKSHHHSIQKEVLFSRFPSLVFKYPLSKRCLVTIKPGEVEGSYLMTTYSAYLPEPEKQKQEELVSAKDIKFILETLERL